MTRLKRFNYSNKDIRSKGLKWCPKCQTPKSFSEFAKNKSIKGGYNGWCKLCVSKLEKVRYGTEGYRFSTLKAQAKARHIYFDLTLEQFKSFWGWPCAYCGESIKTIGLDRIDSSKGYTVDNLLSCCGDCNYMKSDMSLDEFVERCRKIVKTFDNL